MWISAEFKIYLIKEFQRLKDEEDKAKNFGWNIQRILSKLNYRIHTDTIKDTLIPPTITRDQSRQGLHQSDRLQKLNETAIQQMRSLLANPTVKKMDR